jgi:hypothetical protein
MARTAQTIAKQELIIFAIVEKFRSVNYKKEKTLNLIIPALINLRYPL